MMGVTASGAGNGNPMSQPPAPSANFGYNNQGTLANSKICIIKHGYNNQEPLNNQGRSKSNNGFVVFTGNRGYKNQEAANNQGPSKNYHKNNNGLTAPTSNYGYNNQRPAIYIGSSSEASSPYVITYL